MPRVLKPTSERFWEKVDKHTKSGCWEWRSSIRGNGYGAFFTHFPGEKRKCHGAHRFSWELVNGKIPVGLWVLHKCDNRICVNPEHLFLGDRIDNMRDCAIKGRIKTVGKSRLTHCKNGHEFNEQNTRINKHGHRICKACKCAANRKRGQAMTEPDLIAEIKRRKKLPLDQRGDMRELKRARNRMARHRRSKAQTT